MALGGRRSAEIAGPDAAVLLAVTTAQAAAAAAGGRRADAARSEDYPGREDFEFAALEGDGEASADGGSGSGSSGSSEARRAPKRARDSQLAATSPAVGIAECAVAGATITLGSGATLRLAVLCPPGFPATQQGAASLRRASGSVSPAKVRQAEAAAAGALRRCAAAGASAGDCTLAALHAVRVALASA